MKNFKLKKIRLLSKIEETAKEVIFDEKVTVILGKNDTGKSSLLKSVYWAFGADAAVIHPRWKGLDVISMATFMLDEDEYNIIRDGSFYAVFDANYELLHYSERITSGLAPYLAGLFEFKLSLTDHQGNFITPTPAFFFLPYYVDQDKGWQTSLSSFDRLSQFKAWKKPTSEYHLGITNNEFYEAEASKKESEAKIENFQNDIRSITYSRDKVYDNLQPNTISIDIDAFKVEIDQLLQRCQSLRELQENYKANLMDLRNEKAILEAQLLIAESTAVELAADYEFATFNQLDNLIDCPTCGTSHRNGFAERFSIAQDEDRVLNLINHIREDISSVDERISSQSAELENRTEDIEAVEKLLVEKRGTVELRDVLLSAGRQNWLAELNKIVEEQTLKSNEEAVRLKESKDVLKAIQKNNKERTETIIDYFSARMRHYCELLDVQTLSEEYYRVITGNIKEIGSDLPRGLLAYYYSFFHTAKEFGSFSLCPIVLDSPNQQAQDDANLVRVLNFIFDQQPSDSQLILGLEDDLGIKHSGITIELSQKYSLLERDSYDDIANIILPLLSIATSAAAQIQPQQNPS